MVAFECRVRGGQIVPETLKQNLEWPLLAIESVLRDVPDGHIYAVKVGSVEGYPKESFAIVNVDCVVKDGDLVVCGAGRIDELMWVSRQRQGHWHIYPVRGADRYPWPQPDLDAVFGKVFKTIDDVEQFLRTQGNEGLKQYG